MEDDQFKLLLDRLDAQTEKLGDIHSEFREFKGGMDAKVGSLEDEARTDRMWGRIQTVAILPIVTVLHIISKKLGI